MSNIDWNYLRQLLWTWIDERTIGTPVIWADQEGVSPDEAFINLKIMSFRRVGGQDYIGDPDSASGDVIVSGNREFTLSIQGFGDGANQKVIDIDEAFSDPNFLAELNASGIAFIRSIGVSDLSALINDREIEERAVLDVILRIGIPFTEDIIPVPVGVIEKVTGEGTVNGQKVTINVQSGS